MSLENISEGSMFDNMEKIELNRNIYDFFVSYETIDVSDMKDIHNYLKKRYFIKAWIH